MLDKYYYGDVSRISPEAPVPVVKVESEKLVLGGAGNVVNNIFGLGANSTIISSVAEDLWGNYLKSLLDEINVNYSFIPIADRTITKLRVVSGKQQIVRLDFEECKPLLSQDTDTFKRLIDKNISSCNISIISDYGKGVCSEELCQYLIYRAAEYRHPIIVDPKGSDWSKYNGATIITPNVKELGEVVGMKIPNEDSIIVEIGETIRKKYNIKYLIVTRSEKGITILSEDGYKHIPTKAREVFDVSGAGDTVVGTMAVMLAKGLNIEESVNAANYAAGIVVGKAGTVPVTSYELESVMYSIHHSKIVPIDKINCLVKNLKSNGKKIVFTNGCFDILHKGHCRYLKSGKDLGDILILGLNSDKSVKRLKGEQRPINNENDRAELLSGLEVIDYIVIFDDDTPLELIKIIEPDILIKGGDYKASDVVGKEYAKDTLIIDFVEGYSTTNIVNKVMINN